MEQLPDQGGEISVQSSWEFDPATSPTAVNQFLLNAGFPGPTGAPLEYYVTFGHVNAPIIVPTEAGLASNLPDGKAPVSIVGHFVFNRERLVEFRDLLSTWIEGLPAVRDGSLADPDAR